MLGKGVGAVVSEIGVRVDVVGAGKTIGLIAQNMNGLVGVLIPVIVGYLKNVGGGGPGGAVFPGEAKAGEEEKKE